MRIVGLMTVLLVGLGCAKSTPQIVQSRCSAEAGSAQLTATPTYEQNIEPLIETYCLGCHQSDAQDPALHSGRESSARGEDFLNEIVEEVVTRDMPKERILSDEQISQFSAWRAAGFPSLHLSIATPAEPDAGGEEPAEVPTASSNPIPSPPPASSPTPCR